ncbi:Expansin-A13-like protein [Drosera capensis]
MKPKPNPHALPPSPPPPRAATTLTLLLLLLPLGGAHYHYPTSRSNPTPFLTDWAPARATYTASTTPSTPALYPACGYSDPAALGYGLATASLSPSLFSRGSVCGSCFELRCVDDLRNCIPGTSVIVTATDFCAPNYGLGDEEGGLCNAGNNHFIVPIEVFDKIAIWKAGNMAVQYRRIKCRRAGGIRFAIDGSGAFISVLVSNVAGAGDVTALKIKGSQTGWLPMGRNWGQNWILNADLKKQPLSFEVTTSDGVTLTSYNVATGNWNFGQTFEGKQFD